MTLADIRKAIGERTDDEVTIVGVAKKQPVERVLAAVAEGLTDVANNYEQEGRALRDRVGGHVRWHFVGHVQSRKAKLLVDYDLVQSLERVSVAEAWHRALEPEGRRIDALVEVNIGDEAQKSGVRPAELATLLEALRPLTQVRVRGLMAMPPPLEPVESRRPFFRTMSELFETFRHLPDFDILSMGTSADFAVAVEEGATMVRLGETLFGKR